MSIIWISFWVISDSSQVYSIHLHSRCKGGKKKNEVFGLVLQEGIVPKFQSAPKWQGVGNGPET
jgi:hypothetical protein